MRIVLDDSEKVSSVDCSVEKMDSHQLVEFGCLDPAEMGKRVGHGNWRELAGITELAEVRFWHPEMNGSNTHMVLSPDGRILAASDVENRTWLIDIDSFKVVGRHDNARPNFWSLKGVPEPRVAFAADGRRLVITQGELTTFMTQAGDRFVPSGQLNGPDIEVARFVCCPEGLVGLGAGRVSWIAADGDVHTYTDGEGRLDFGVSGVAVTRPSPPGTLRLAALDSAFLAPSPRMVLAENGRHNVVLDTRNDFARHRATANFEFSPDGLWLARNSCRHLELWDSGQLSQLLSDEGPETLSPVLAMMIPLLSRTSYEDGCHGPIVFHPNGRVVAAASDNAIHIWRIADGRQEMLIDVEEGRYGLHVVAIAFDTDQGLAAVVSDYRGTINVARWKLSGSL
jgi:WD40 repeat protein